jgi:nucleoside-triphosphatase THEP1
MDNIIEPNESFNFNQLTLAHPSGIQGGAYFTKIEYYKKPLYIQTSKSLTRQGFVKTGKKYYCDLMFDKNSETLINWFENLEERCQTLLYEKRYDWFQNSLEKNDIETAFNSVIRIYKSGKYYLIRTNIKNTRTDEPAVNIYNENEVTLNMSRITNETNIISILEIQGIKFTSRNFQIEIELKQVMVINDEPIFKNCLIKTIKNKDDNVKNENVKDKNTLEENNIKFLQDAQVVPLAASSTQNTLDTLDINNLDDKINDLDLDNNDLNLDNNDLDLDNNDLDLDSISELDPNTINNTNDNSKPTGSSLEINFEDLDNKTEENPNELSEFNIDIDLENNLESMTLKKPNQVYFELYKEARNKAKLAKRNAILAYLEAKNIKKTYMIENINDSDSDFDAEIDEASESELDNL